MNNKRSTKRALLTSVMALVMCVVMLVGTTFAWFTDTASTGVNRIQAGNLDIEVEYSKTMAADSWKPIDNTTTNLFTDNEGNAMLWEPGAASVVYLRITNKGNLAVKYNMALNKIAEVESKNVEGNEFKLSDYIKFGYDADVTARYAGRKAAIEAVSATAKNLNTEKAALTVADAGNDYAVLTDTNETKTVALVVYMPDSVGNEANYDANRRGNKAPSIDLRLDVLATQAVHEFDSLGNEYDEQAEYPTIPVKVTTVAEMRKAIEELNENGGKLVLDIGMDVSGYSTVGNLDIKQGELTVNLNGHTLQVAYSGKSGTPAIKVAKGAKVTLEGGTVQSRKGFSMYTIENSGELVLKDVTVKNLATDTDWNISGEGYFKPVCLRVLDGTVTITGNTNISGSCAILVEHKHGNSSTPLPNPQVIIDKGMTGTITGTQVEKCVNADGTDYKYTCYTKNAGFIKDQR